MKLLQSLSLGDISARKVFFGSSLILTIIFSANMAREIYYEVDPQPIIETNQEYSLGLGSQQAAIAGEVIVDQSQNALLGRVAGEIDAYNNWPTLDNITENDINRLIQNYLINAINARFILSGTGDLSTGCLQIDSEGVVTTKGSDCRVRSSGGGGGGSATLAIGSTVTGATQGSILFAGAAGILAQDNTNLAFDDATDSLTVGGDLTLGGLAGGGAQCVTVDNAGLLGAAACGGGAITPWTSAIDADGFALQDALNLEFRTAAGSAPAGTVVAVFQDNSGDLTANVLTAKTFNIAVNGTDEYNFSSTGIALNTNDITGGGTITAATFNATSALQLSGVSINTAGTLNNVAYLNQANTFTANQIITKADPSLVLNTTTATDTDFWLGVVEDGGGDDDDFFQIGDGTTTGTNPFFTINTTGQTGILTTPRQQFSVGDYLDIYSGAANGSSVSSIRASSFGNLVLNADAGAHLYFNFDSGGQVYFPNGTTGAPALSNEGNGADTGINFPGTEQIDIITNGVERISIEQSGFVGIGTVSPENLLEVQGVEGADAVIVLDADDGDDAADTWTINSDSASNSLLLENNGSLAFEVTPSGDTYTVGDIYLDPGDFIGHNTNNNIVFGGSNDFQFYGDGNMIMSVYNAATNGGGIYFNGRTVTRTSGNSDSFYFDTDFTPTSGTGTYSAMQIASTINQTGGASGISRGLYINPTITAAADYRAVDIAVNSTSAYGIYQSGANTENYFAGNVGIGIIPSSTLDISGTTTMRGISAPAVSSSGQGRVYFDSTSNTFKASQNAGAYADIIETITVDTTYYVCPSGLANCAYDGDGGQVASPSDSNACTTKAAPCATIAGVKEKFKHKVIAAVVTVQLADTTGGTCYQPDRVEFSNTVFGAAPNSVLAVAILDEVDTYPQGYIYIKGNTTTPNNVAIVGATTCAGTASDKDVAIASVNTTMRLRGVQFKYFRSTDGFGGGDNGAWTCLSSTCFFETSNAISDATTAADGGATVSGYLGSTIKMGGTFTIQDVGVARANANSTMEFRTPLGWTTVTHDNDGGSFGFFVNEFSHMFMEGLTVTFTGTGAYNAFAAWTRSSINWNGDAVTNVTMNAANATMLHAKQGSHIDEACGGTDQTCTFTSFNRRVIADNSSYVSYGGTGTGNLGTSGNLISDNSVAVDNFGSGSETASIRKKQEAQLLDRLQVAGSQTYHYGIFRGDRSRGTLVSPTVVTDGDKLVGLAGCGYDSTDYMCEGEISIQAAGTFSTLSRPTRITFATHPANNDANATERLRIEYNGDVGIGDTSPDTFLDVESDQNAEYIASFFNDGNNADRYGLQVQGGADDGSGTTYYLNALDGDGTQVGYIANTAGTFALTDISDVRTKTNVEDTEMDAMEILTGLRVVDFNRLSNPDGPKITGFIAQEVQDVYPKIVTVGENGMLGLTKENLIPVLVKGFQNQQSQITSLQSQINFLQGNAGGNLSSAAPLVLAGHLYLSGDSVGEARILEGSKSVRVSFSKPYEFQPIVTVTPQGRVGSEYWVSDKDATGFTIYIEDEGEGDISFDWHSFAGPEVKLTVSNGQIIEIELGVVNSPELLADPIENNLPETEEIVEDAPLANGQADPEQSGDVLGEEEPISASIELPSTE